MSHPVNAPDSDRSNNVDDRPVTRTDQSSEDTATWIGARW